MPSAKSRSEGLGISYSSVEAGTPPRTEDSAKSRAKTPESRGTSPPRPQRRATRDSWSQNFNSFSAIPPSDQSPSRRLPITPEHLTKRRSHTPGPVRAASTASVSTTASQLRKARSADVLRRFGKSSGLEGRPYVPLSETDIDDDPGSVIGAAVMSQTSSRSSGTMEGEIRSVQVDIQYMPGRSGSVMTGWTRRTEASRLGQPGPSRRPLPVEPTIMEDEDADATRRKRRSTITQQDYDESSSSRPRPTPLRTGTSSSDQTEHEPDPEAMRRSLSTPTGQQSPAKPYFSYPEGLDDPPPAVRPKLDEQRTSSVSSGIHSKNKIILSAESGALMLEYSDAGEWKQGQKIIGKGKGLIPTPDCRSEVSTVDSTAEDTQERSSRPRAESRVSTHTQSGYLNHGRSRSENDAALARQGTLFHPASSHDRSSDELGVMLGKKSRKPSRSKLLPAPESIWQDNPPDSIRIEASKKRKARVEVDIVLERETVVEGGEVRGRMEVRVYGSKRTEGLRIGAGKIRVVGFEEASDSHRHIFYHLPHPLPQFAIRPHEQQTPGLSLFASGPDGDGFRLASEGTHSIPFRLRLPLDGGAKGSYASDASRGPRVRYVVVGSVKLFLPLTGKRSIAHFYRTFTILPFLRSTNWLSASREPIEARTENGLGWSLGGDKGKVSLRVALGRGTWISGQKLWCEVGIHNDSSRRIKNLHLAILQTVQTFNPNPLLDPSERPRSVSKRRSADREALLNQMDSADMDLDACQTSTQQRKVSEEVLHSDFASTGAGRVTGKGWWTGVEPGESGHWDLSLSIPPDLVSIRRTRLVEVKHNLRVSVSNSIFVDIPIQLIDYLSIDPPPMPGDAPRAPVPQSAPVKAKMPRDDSLGLPVHMIHQKGAFYPLKDPSISEEDEEPESSHPMQMEQVVEQRRAEPAERPMSMASDYTEDLTPILPPAAQPRRPLHTRLTSYLSSPTEESDETGMLSSSADHQSEEADKALSAARRAQGRARSLAALERAAAREAADADLYDKAQSSDDQDQSEEAGFLPLETPFEEPFKMLGTDGSSDAHPTPRAAHQSDFDQSPTAGAAASLDDGPGLNDLHRAEDEDDDYVDVGNDTVLENLVGGRKGDGEDDGDWIDESDDEDAAPKPKSTTHAPLSSDDPLDADHPIHQAISLGTAKVAVDPQLAFMTGEMPHTRDRYARSFNGSVATNNTHISDESSEIGEVLEAKKELLDMPSQATIVHSPQGQTSKLDTSFLAVDTNDNLSPKTSRDVESRSSAATSPFSRRKSKTNIPPSPASSTEQTAGKDLNRSRSTKSRSLRDATEEEQDVPDLAPSVDSDAGSSEEYVTIESPITEEPQLRTTTSTRTLPRIPVQSSAPLSDFAGMSATPAENLWLPAGTLLRNQMERLRGETPVASFGSGSSPPSADDHSQDASHEGSSNSHESASTGQTHQSLLPSVKSKIAHLEERQEALRRMSLASFGTPSGTPRPESEPPVKVPTLRTKTSALKSEQSTPKSKTRPSRSRTLGAEDKLQRSAPPDVAPRKTADPVSHRSTARTPGLAYREEMDDSEPEVYQVNSDVGHDDTDDRSFTPVPVSPTSPVSPRSPPAKTKRKSYTAALAPRPARQISDDSGLHDKRDRAQRIVVSPTTGHPIVMPSVSEAGHGQPPPSPRRSHTPTASPARPRTAAPPPGRAKTMGERPTSYIPVPRAKSSAGNLRRDKSTSSTSTTATSVEAALMNRKQQLPRRQTRAQTMYVEGKYGADGGHEYQPYSSSPTYGSPPGISTSTTLGPGQYFTQYGGGGGYYNGGYGSYHDPYKSLGGPGTPGFARPADRPSSIRGVEASEWDKFY